MSGERPAARGGTSATSDVRRPRRMLVAGAASIAGVLAAVVARPGGSAEGGGVLSPIGVLASPGPVSASHAAARVGCDACHGDRPGEPAAGKACVACHGDHASTRAGHRALAASGALGCPSCHASHGGVEPRIVAAGRVAGVPLAACAGCHDPSRGTDPVRACAGSGPWAGFVVCFDEHQTPSAPLASRGVCAREHGPDRFVAWEQARGGGGPSFRRAPSAWAPWAWIGSGSVAGALAWLAGALTGRGERRRESGPSVPAPTGGPPPARLAPAPPARVRLPRIDATTCLGCQACVEACPFDVLEVERYVAVLARPDACCGLAACADVCPNGSLRIVDTNEPVADRPCVDDHLESLDRPGVFVAGDLTGIPLIRHAVAQGARVVDRVASLRQADRAGEGRVRSARGPASSSREPAAVDLVVVGAGPAGLSAALRARESGLTCVVLEQAELAASIRAFPRGKIVQDAPVDLPLEGRFRMRDGECTKEELVAHWRRIVRVHRLDVRERHTVTAVDGAVGAFLVRAVSRAPAQVHGGREVAIAGARVLLAVGRRGTPRPLQAEIAPEATGRVVHGLSDARAWAGRRVLVVGLGDAALEAIAALARQRGTAVTVSYRGTGFSRGSARNVAAVKRLIDLGRVRVLFETRVTRVDLRTARVEGPAGAEEVPTDGVLALLGGEPARTLLACAGVRLSSPPG